MTPAEMKYAALHERLLALIAEGLGDSDEADALRDEMDAPWNNMSDAERNRYSQGRDG
jgi:hypothetical protein